MKYKEDVTFRDIDGYRYEATEDLYKAEKPEDSCYCIKKSKDETGKPSCFLDGLLDLYTCYGTIVQKFTYDKILMKNIYRCTSFGIQSIFLSS